MGKQINVRVEGGGVAAGIVAALLRQRGYAVSLAPPRNSSRRMIAIPRLSVDLLHDLLGVAVDRIVQARWVAERRVAWNSAEFAQVSSAALVCEAGGLAHALATHGLQRSRPVDSGEFAPGDPDWVVIAGGRPTDSRARGGHRRATTGRVESLPGFQSDATTVACVPDGWLFAVADPGGGVALVLVSPFDAAGAAQQQQMLRAAVDYLWPGCSDDVVVVDDHAAAPSFDPACAAPGRMAVGDAALALDPLRGDGVGFAARGGLLAQSVIAAIADGCDREACLGHYAARLARVFRTHLTACILHYADAWNADIWRTEIGQMSRCLDELAPDRALDFRLRERDLISA